LLNSARVEQAAVQRRHDLAAGQRVHRPRPVAVNTSIARPTVRYFRPLQVFDAWRWAS
jgi:hypothetical protein